MSLRYRAKIAFLEGHSRAWRCQFWMLCRASMSDARHLRLADGRSLTRLRYFLVTAC